MADKNLDQRSKEGEKEDFDDLSEQQLREILKDPLRNKDSATVAVITDILRAKEQITEYERAAKHLFNALRNFIPSLRLLTEDEWQYGIPGVSERPDVMAELKPRNLTSEQEKMITDTLKTISLFKKMVAAGHKAVPADQRTAEFIGKFSHSVIARLDQLGEITTPFLDAATQRIQETGGDQGRLHDGGLSGLDPRRRPGGSQAKFSESADVPLDDAEVRAVYETVIASLQARLFALVPALEGKILEIKDPALLAFDSAVSNQIHDLGLDSDSRLKLRDVIMQWQTLSTEVADIKGLVPRRRTRAALEVLKTMNGRYVLMLNDVEAALRVPTNGGDGTDGERSDESETNVEEERVVTTLQAFDPEYWDDERIRALQSARKKFTGWKPFKLTPTEKEALERAPNDIRIIEKKRIEDKRITDVEEKLRAKHPERIAALTLAGWSKDEIDKAVRVMSKFALLSRQRTKKAAEKKLGPEERDILESVREVLKRGTSEGGVDRVALRKRIRRSLNLPAIDLEQAASPPVNRDALRRRIQDILKP